MGQAEAVKPEPTFIDAEPPPPILLNKKTNITTMMTKMITMVGLNASFFKPLYGYVCQYSVVIVILYYMIFFIYFFVRLV